MRQRQWNQRLRRNKPVTVTGHDKSAQFWVIFLFCDLILWMFVCRFGCYCCRIETKEQSAILYTCHSCLYLCVHNLRRCIEQRVRRSFPFGYWIHLLFRYYTGWYGCVGIAERFGSERGTRATPRSPLHYFYAHTAIHPSDTEYLQILQRITWFRFEGFLCNVRTPGERANKERKWRARKTMNDSIRFFVQPRWSAIFFVLRN